MTFLSVFQFVLDFGYTLLATLNQQEKKYAAELDAALAQYTELQRQAADMDAIELDTARHAIRSNKDRETAQRLQAAYGKKFDFGTLTQSRKDIAKILDKPAESVSIREKFHQSIQQDNKHRRMKGRAETMIPYDTFILKIFQLKLAFQRTV